MTNTSHLRITAVLAAPLFSLLASVTLAGEAAPPKPMPYTVPDPKRVRVIMDMDEANEIDDDFATLHALLTPQFMFKGIVAAHFRGRAPGVALEQSHQQIQNLLAAAGMKSVTVKKGAAGPLTDPTQPQISEGARFIIEEAKREDSHRLFLIFGGPLTDIASAYLMDPSIANRLTLLWTGGAGYPKGGWEFNIQGDPIAANVVFASPIPLFQVTKNGYSCVRVGFAEAHRRLAGRGQVGPFLLDCMNRFNHGWAYSPGWPRGEDWTWGDSPLVMLAMSPDAPDDRYEMIRAPQVNIHSLEYIPGSFTNRAIRVYETFNGRATLEDLFNKLDLAYP